MPRRTAQKKKWELKLTEKDVKGYLEEFKRLDDAVDKSLRPTNRTFVPVFTKEHMERLRKEAREKIKEMLKRKDLPREHRERLEKHLKELGEK